MPTVQLGSIQRLKATVRARHRRPLCSAGASYQTGQEHRLAPQQIKPQAHSKAYVATCRRWQWSCAGLLAPICLADRRMTYSLR